MAPTLSRLSRFHRLMLTITLMVLFSGCAQEQSTPLIPKAELFGNPVKTQARISPDARYISYLAPNNGVLNVWVRTIGGDDDRPLTTDVGRGIHQHYWGPDSKHIIFPQDVDGRGNDHLIVVNIEDGSTRDLTPFPNIRASIIVVGPNISDVIMIQMNKRIPQLFDAYTLNPTTGELKLVAENPGTVAGWIQNAEFEVLGALAATADGGFQLQVRDNPQAEFRPLVTWGTDDGGRAYGFTPDGKGIYIADSRGADLVRLKVIDIATKEQTVLAAHSEVDLGEVMINPRTHRVEAVAFNKDRNRWTILDSSLVSDFESLRTLGDGQFMVAGRDDADEYWMVAYSADVTPIEYYLYERKTQTATFLFSGQPSLKNAELASMQYVEIKARDGLHLPAFLTLPPGVPAKNLPLIVNVHGGPWTRDSWGFRSDVQWMANRGYAVLQINYRGSVGFGNHFMSAGNKEWGGKMQLDLADGVAWAVNEGYADPNRVGIFGMSFGGYAVLAGAAYTPDVYACGVDMMGPSNLFTFYRSIPSYWTPFLKILTQRMGDPVADSALLVERSPYFSVDKIKIPLLIVQGANDPRVKRAESDQMVDTLKANGREVEYVVYENEGHGLARPENRTDFYKRAEKFLAEHLGGRVEK